MTRAQRIRIVVWAVFGTLGLARAAYAIINNDALGLLLGILWFAFGAYKAWNEAKRIDEEALVGPRQKQPDRPAKVKRK